VSGSPFVAIRPLLVAEPRVRIPLVPGDRIVASTGATVAPGDLLAERVREPRLVEVDGDRGSVTSHPGAWIAAEPARRGTAPAGELLFAHGGRRRIATGPHPDLVTAPAAGTVVAIRPGVEIVIEAVRLRERLIGADLLITGEGRLDRQSMMGKVVGSVARMARSAHVPCVAIVGTTGPGAEECLEALDRYATLDAPLEQTESRLTDVAALLAAESL